PATVDQDAHAEPDQQRQPVLVEPAVASADELVLRAADANVGVARARAPGEVERHVGEIELRRRVEAGKGLGRARVGDAQQELIGAGGGEGVGGILEESGAGDRAGAPGRLWRVVFYGL